MTEEEPKNEPTKEEIEAQEQQEYDELLMMPKREGKDQERFSQLHSKYKKGKK